MAVQGRQGSLDHLERAASAAAWEHVPIESVGCAQSLLESRPRLTPHPSWHEHKTINKILNIIIQLSGSNIQKAQWPTRLTAEDERRRRGSALPSYVLIGDCVSTALVKKAASCQ
jgi:hypothetical protein